MLRYYFEDNGGGEENRGRAELFSGLAIAKAGEAYVREMGQYPVVMLTLKSAKQRSFAMAYASLKQAIMWEFQRHEKMVSGKLETPEDMEKYRIIRAGKGEDSDYFSSLLFLSRCLYQAYGKRCIILIDEYDVPLESAYFEGYYDEMAAFIRSLFESAFKTNAFLEFAVITGCLRVSRESIFTGLNNLEIISVLRSDYGESYYHGFLAGLLGRNSKYRVLSNREAGLGRADIILKTPRISKGRAIVMEIKAVKDFGDMENGCAAALRQIEEKKYLEELRQEGYEDILAYGVCFFRKECIIQKMDK